MKRSVIIGLCLAISLVAVVAASASTLSIPGGVGGMTAYGGHYVGPIGANLDGSGEIAGGITCLDFNSTTYVPNLGFEVYVGTLSPVDLSHAKFRSDSTALFKYQEAAWLLGQMSMSANSSEIGVIQFAIWRIFTTISDSSGRNFGRETYWMNLAAGINPAKFDFSSVRIYTPTDTTNQEFMSGTASPVPIPGAVWLLGSGLLGLVSVRKRFTR
jgi:hypothetical protein